MVVSLESYAKIDIRETLRERVSAHKSQMVDQHVVPAHIEDKSGGGIV